MPDRVPFANGLAKKGKRLLLLVPHLELGGADKFNLDLVRLMIRDHGYEVTVAATLSDAAPWASLLTDLTPDVFILSDFLRLSACPLFLRYLIESRHPDVMCIANSALGYQLLPYVRSHAPDLPVVDFVHMEEDYWKSGGYPRLSVDYGEYLDLTVASSQHLRQWMEKAGGSPDRIRVCTTNVDAHEWSRDRFSLPQLRAKWAVTGEWPVILFAGRLCEQKQPRILVRVLDRLRRDGCGFQALVAGDGPDRAEIESFVRDGASDQVRLMGPLPPADVRELMALSDILFLPSKMEGIALVLFEAMSMGVVPVGANVGGQAELVTPDCGILLDPGPDEVTRYAEALRKLLRDPPARGRLARAARERILAGFTLDKMGAAMAGVFEEASRAAARPVRQPIPVAVGDLIARETIEQTHLDAMAGGLWNNLSAKRTECERLAAENAALRSRLSGRLPRVVARLGRDALERWLQAHGFPHCRLRRRA
jgi:glycosyltransferase involved in cell wall biosynthesis